MERATLVEEILYSMAGLDSSRIYIRKGKKIDISLHKSISVDHIHIINNLMDILIGVREIRYYIEEMYYKKEHTKQCFLMGVEKEVEKFFQRVCALRRVYLRGELPIEALPFVFQADISLFKALRSMLREVDRADSMCILQIVLDSCILGALEPTQTKKDISPILLLLTSTINKLLVSLIEGEPVPEYFEVKEKYGYRECFWSSHFRAKRVPSFLKDKVDFFYTLSKLSKIRRASGDKKIFFRGDILIPVQASIVYNDVCIAEYADALYKTPLLNKEWSGAVEEIFSALILDTERYSLLFNELEEAVYFSPTKETVSATNYIMRTNTNTYSDIEKQIDVGSLSFLAETPFAREFFAQENTSQISYVHSNISLSKTLESIQDAHLARNVSSISYLQGLDCLFRPRSAVSFFFSARAVSEVRLLFRLVFSLYAIEYYLVSKEGRSSPHRILRHHLLCFVTGMRMHITERVETQKKALLSENNPTAYYSALENALSLLMKESLLTVPSLIHFYCSFFSITFFYLELVGKETFSMEEVEELLNNYKKMAAEALPYVRPSAVLILFETLAGQ